MSIPDKMKTLARHLNESVPGAMTEFTAFPSGAAMLDVRVNGRLFVMAYSPAGGFGVDESREEEGFDTGYRFISRDFDSAATELQQLMKK
jgi:hypothetical protein